MSRQLIITKGVINSPKEKFEEKDWDIITEYCEENFEIDYEYEQEELGINLDANDPERIVKNISEKVPNVLFEFVVTDSEYPFDITNGIAKNGKIKIGKAKVIFEKINESELEN